MRKLELIALCVVLSCAASAQTVYKEVDKDGKVTYTDKKPDDNSKKTEKVDINTNRNITQPLAKKEEKEEREGSSRSSAKPEQRIARDNDLLEKLTQARENLERAKEALASAQTPADDEWINTIRGARIPSEAYYQRVKTFEDAVKKAEEDLASAETAYQRGASS